MALQGKIQHKGIEVTGYVKVSIIGISESVVRNAAENYDAKALDNPLLSPIQREALLQSMTYPVKKFMLQFGYSISSEKGAETFATGQCIVECEPDCNTYGVAYAHLSELFTNLKHA